MKNKYLSLEYMRQVMLLACAVIALAGHCQLLRTTYFMEGVHYRLQLNPALAPSRGYVNLPAVSNTGASFYSNALGLRDVIDVLSNEEDADYFVSDSFMGRLKDKNHALATAGTDIIAAGWWHGQSFMSVNVGVKVNGNFKAPKALFSFMRDMRGMNSIDYSDFVRSIGNEEVNLTAYTELGFGYTRQLNDRFSVGGRVKGLLGHGNMHLVVKDAVVKTNLQGLSPEYNWTYGNPAELLEADGTASIDIDADLETSFEGLDLLTNDKAYIDEVKFKASHTGVAGVGAAVDFGISWRATRQVTLSASLVDLGFIRWSKGCTQVAHSNTQDLKFNSEALGDLARFADVISTSSPVNIDILRLEIDEQGAKSRTTSLSSTMTLGADYALNDKVTLGALYSHHNAGLLSQDEVTFSANLRPSEFVELAVSYSPLSCGGKSAGVALKVGPVFLGTDYIYTGKNTRSCNALAGVSIPLGKKPND